MSKTYIEEPKGEVKAIAACFQALDEVDKRAALRILRYLIACFEDMLYEDTKSEGRDKECCRAY